MNHKIVAVTISHQLGSGGAYIGKKLAERLEIPFLDREILQKVARQLDLMEEEVENREERLSTSWDNILRPLMWIDPTIVSEDPPRVAPSDQDLFEVECSTIRQVAEKSSAVFLGRCGWDILREHPGHVSILVTANQAERIQRLRELYQITDTEAQELIRSNDRERDNYSKKFTQKYWLDARYYDLCINTSVFGWDTAVDLAEKCVKVKLQSLASARSAQQTTSA